MKRVLVHLKHVLLGGALAATAACGHGSPPAARRPIIGPRERAQMIAARETGAAEKRAQAIQLLEELLSMHPGEIAEGDALFKLAELYWEDSRQRLVLAMQAYDADTESCKKKLPGATEEKCADITPPKLDVARSEKLYKQLAEKHPRFPRMDTVLYLIGFAAHEDGRKEEAVGWLEKLIATQPSSPLLPDAWMLIGERWFDSDFGKARAAYEKVLEHKDSPVYDLALFKTAWCDWKLGDTRRAAERFKEVLDIAGAAEKSGTEESRRRSGQLRDEALAYLTLLLTEDENVTPRDAYGFLSSIGGERYSREVLGKLGDLFFAQSRWDRAVQAWQFLVELDPDHPDAPKHQLHIIDAFLAMDEPDAATQAAKVLADSYGPESRWVKANKSNGKLLAATTAAMEEHLAGLAKQLHGDAQSDEQRRKKPDLTRYKRAAELYAIYLTRFGDSPRASEQRYLRAEILYFKLDKIEEAADEYLAVGKDNKPVGPRNKDALLKAMAAYEKIRPKQAGKRTSLSPSDHKFAEAVGTYAKLFPADADVVNVIYRNGQMFFDYGDYDEAVKQFGLIITKYPDDPNAGPAGDRILEALAKGEDYVVIEDWAKKLKKARAFQTVDEQKRLDEIIVQAIGKQAEKQAKAGKYEDAAATFVRAQKEYPQDKRAAGSLMSAGIVLEAGKQPSKAAEAYLSLVERYPAAPEAAGAAFAAGRAYEQMAYFDQAADAYSRVAYKYPDDKNAADALFNLAVLAQALGRSKDAIQANLDYARRYPKSKEIEELSFRVGVVYADDRNYRQAAAAFLDFVKKYPQSARVVEALARAGKVMIDAGSTKAAEDDLGRALARWKSLPKPQQAAAAPYAAQARYLQGEAVFAEYQAIGLDVKPAQVKAVLDKKRVLLAKAQGIYTDVVSYGDPTWATAALGRIGQIYEQFADQLRKTATPPGFSEEEAQIYRDELDRFVVDMEDKAVAIYEAGYKKALELKVYGPSTRLLREGLGRLAEGRYPPERETRARAGTWVGDRPPEPPLVKDVRRE